MSASVTETQTIELSRSKDSLLQVSKDSKNSLNLDQLPRRNRHGADTHMSPNLDLDLPHRVPGQFAIHND